MPKQDQTPKDQDLELLKAVAQAWHAQTGNPKPAKQFDAQKNRFNYKCKPTRFKLEAMKAMTSKESSSSKWDFSESLLDSYEIVTLSKKLEANLALDQPMERSGGRARTGKRSRTESKNSLRNLLSKVSSKRFDAGDVPGEGRDFSR